MIRRIAIDDTIGYRAWGSAIQYGTVVAIDHRDEMNRPSRLDEIHVFLRHSGRTVLVQRWRIVERYKASKSKPKASV